MKWLARIFTWWHGQTLNTALHTLLFGKFVGKDEYGNRYYRTRKIDKALGFERRWVIYAGESDGSMTPQGWYGWLHHTFDVPPTQEEYAPRTWELPHQPNLTRTPQAWRPPGSTLAANARPAITRPGRRKARWSLVHGWTRPPRRGKHHLDRQPGAGHYSCVDKAELSKSLA